MVNYKKMLEHSLAALLFGWSLVFNANFNLITSIRNGDIVEVARIILEVNVNQPCVDVKTWESITPLACAIRSLNLSDSEEDNNNRLELMSLLINAGAAIDNAILKIVEEIASYHVRVIVKRILSSVLIQDFNKTINEAIAHDNDLVIQLLCSLSQEKFLNNLKDYLGYARICRSEKTIQYLENICTVDSWFS